MAMRTTVRCGMILAVTAALLTIGGCPPLTDWLTPATNTNENGPAALARFTSADELLNYFKDQATARTSNTSYSRGLLDFLAPAAAPTVAEDAAGGAATGNGTQDSSSSSFSTTNVQETGVDESDVFKSDGDFFYIAKGRTLRIVAATPLADLRQVSQVEFDVAISELYVFGSKLIALGQKYSYGTPSGAELMIWPPYHVGASTVAYQLDIADPANPAKIFQKEFDGSLVSSRLTNGRLILVLTIQPALPTNPTPLAISLMTLNDVLPKVRDETGTASVMVPPENWFHPTAPDGYFTTGVVTIDAADITSVLGAVAVMANAGTVYSSTDALYLTDTAYMSDSSAREVTAIHKLIYNDQGVAEYYGSGKVPGRPLNQFSLGEYQGKLRVATHVDAAFVWNTLPSGIAFASMPVSSTPTAAASGSGNASSSVVTAQVQDANAPAQTGDEPPYNAVYVLGENAGALDVIGKVEGIAPTEQIYAARFMGDHGFLVTYRKVDPLFVLDLSDATNPRLLGELKVPGFSDYLHPLDDTHLIGVGKYTVPTAQGFDWFQGVQLSLFDVTDWSNPQVVQQITLGGRGSYTDVSNTHKAFAFLPESNLLAIPVQLTEVDQIPWQYGQPIFDGVITYRVDKTTGFTELGRLSSVIYSDVGWVSWRRPAFIGDVAYAITSAGIRAANTSAFETSTKELVLTKNATELGTDDGWPVIQDGGVALPNVGATEPAPSTP